jgi:dihydroorotate dehydrogenase
MAVGATKEERMWEWKGMFCFLAARQSEFKAVFAIQLNFSCPNTGHAVGGLVSEVKEVLELAARILPGVALVPKFSVVQLSLATMLDIGNHPACDALLYSNTVPWGDLPLWVRLVSFGTPFSPLWWRMWPRWMKQEGGFLPYLRLLLKGKGVKQAGGYAGPWLLSLVRKMTRDLRAAGFSKPIIACGGITKIKHVDRLFSAGVNAIEFATVAMVRPKRVQPIAKRAHELGSN